jgi:hypothetical protein
MSSYGAVSPPEYDEECCPGEDQPEGEGWLPLVSLPDASEGWRRIGCDCPVIHQPPCSAAIVEPASEPVAWMTTTGQEACTAGDKAAWLQQSEMQAIAAEHSVPLYATSPPAAPEDAKDAARYRYWRARWTGEDGSLFIDQLIGAETEQQIDSALDAAIEQDGKSNG